MNISKHRAVSIIVVAALIICAAVLYISERAGSENAPVFPDAPKEITDADFSELEAELASIEELIKNAPHDADSIENALAGADFCIADTDAIYPEYLRNSELLFDFCAKADAGQDAALSLWGASSADEFWCRRLICAGGEESCISAGAERDGGGLRLTYCEKRNIEYRALTDGGFIYQDTFTDRHRDAALYIRTSQPDCGLYDYARKYIIPVGYVNVNLFLLDWNSDDFGNVCFNDLLSGLYQAETGDILYARDYPYSDEPFPHSVIPAGLFESTVLSHFVISPDEFRERALYDEKSSTYPWQDISPENVLYFPSLIPEVRSAAQNPDGTVTLLIRVICPDMHESRLFEHELTLDISDEDFRYISNRIVYRSGAELPSPQARIEAQRFDTGAD